MDISLEKHTDEEYLAFFNFARHGVTSINSINVSAIDTKDNSSDNSIFSDVSTNGSIVTLKVKNGYKDSVHRVTVEVTDQDSNVVSQDVLLRTTDYLTSIPRIYKTEGTDRTINLDISEVIKDEAVVGNPTTTGTLLSYNGINSNGDVLSFTLNSGSAGDQEYPQIKFNTANNKFVIQLNIIVV